MKKSNIYTTRGDGGETSLIGGKRVFKNNLQVDLYGTVDELNSQIGAVTALIDGNKTYVYIHVFLIEIQRALFTLGSLLACDKLKSTTIPELSSDIIGEIEKRIDQMDGTLPELQDFILPGGTYVSASLHICRTVCRRLERKLVGFAQTNECEIPINALEFLNRLSDYLFVLARYVNYLEKKHDHAWKTQNSHK